MFQLETLKCAGKIIVSSLLSCLLLLSPLMYATSAITETEEKWFRSTPSEAVFDSLWVGDIVYFRSQQLYGTVWDEEGHPQIGQPKPGNTMTIISGDGVEIINLDFEYGDYTKGLQFTKPGKAQVKIKETNAETGESKEKTFSFTVTDRPADKQIAFRSDNTLNINLKLGERAINTAPLKDVYNGESNSQGVRFFLNNWLNIKFSNMNYGARAYKHIGNCTSEGMNYGYIAYDKFLEFRGGYGGGDSYDYAGDDRTISLEPISYFADALVDGYAMKPGAIPLDVFLNQGEDQVKMGNIGTITIEEPIITANAPGTVKSGSSIRLTTALTNTALDNLKTDEYENESHYEYGSLYKDKDFWYYKLEKRGTNPVAYKPSVTVIEGEDCVAQSEQDYTNTLFSSETLTFKKPGTVKLKITYTQFATTSNLLFDYDWKTEKTVDRDLRYNPEKIITIQVTEDENPATTPTTSKPQSTPGTSTGSTPSQSTYTPGDVNGDGQVNAADALEVLRYAVHKADLTAAQQAAADVTGDGKINAADALLILRKAVGKLDRFPVEEAA